MLILWTVFLIFFCQTNQEIHHKSSRLVKSQVSARRARAASAELPWSAASRRPSRKPPARPAPVMRRQAHFGCWWKKCWRNVVLCCQFLKDAPSWVCLKCQSSPNSVVTLGVLTVIVKAGVARSRWRTGVGRISSLFSWFRACMFVSCVNFHSLRVAQTGVNGFCL